MKILHSFKKSVAFYMAVIMVFGLIAPFAMRPVEVLAEIQTQAGPLRASFFQRLVDNEAGTVVSIENVPAGISNNDVMLIWPINISHDPTAEGLYVLRYFTETEKVEIRVSRRPGAPPMLDVEYHVYSRITGLASPALPTTQIYTHTDSMIFPNIPPTGFGSFPCPVIPGVHIRFLWGAPLGAGGQNDFHVFIEDGLREGFIHDFTMEFYPLTGNPTVVANYNASAMRYYAWRPNAVSPIHPGFIAREPSWPQYDELRSNRIFVFPGLRPIDMTVFPFAAAPNSATQDSHTIPSGGAGIRVFPAWGVPTFGPTAADLPQYATGPLRLFDNEFPAEEDNGLDIRVQMPTFFSEATGRFDLVFEDGRQQHGLADMGMTVIVGPGTSPYAFTITSTLEELEHYPLAGRDPVPTGTTILSSGGEVEILDAAYVMQGANTAARFKVAGLPPSIFFENIEVRIDQVGAGAVTGFFGRATTEVFTPAEGLGPRLHTFLDFRIDPPLAGVSNLAITPFRNHAGGFMSGYYHIYIWAETWPIMPADTQPLRIRFNGDANEISVPLMETSGVHIAIDFFPSATRAMLSQTVVYRPDSVVTIGPPNFFRVVEESIEFTPNRLYAHDIPVARADLAFDVQWQLGLEADIWTMASGGSVVLRYLLNRDIAPNPELPPFAEVWMEIEALPAPSGSPTGSVQVVDYLIVFLDETDPDIRYVTPSSTPPRVSTFVHPVGLLRASLRIESDAVHIELGDNMASSPWNNPFRFPGAPYYMNMQILGQYHVIGDTSDSNRIASFTLWPISPRDYLVLDDFGRATPPPPSNFRVSGNDDPTTPPSMDVNFDVAANAFNAWLNRQYVFDPLISVNVYISTFQNAITTFAAVDPLSLDGAERGVALAVDYADVVHVAGGVSTIDMSASAIQSTLRGGGSNGVVRIENIPIPLNRSTTDSTTALAQTRNWLDPSTGTPTQAVNFTLNNLDENVQFFLFADLVVDRFISSGTALLPGEVIGDDLDRRDRSVSTSIASDTTVGTPGLPGPDEVDPSAPTGLSHIRPTAETSAILYWDAVRSTNPEIITFFELIRVSDDAMDLAELNHPDYRDRALSSWVTGRTDAKGWRTGVGADGHSLAVYTTSATPQIHPYNDPVYTYRDPSEHEDLTLNQVSLTDRSLRPNSLYFYYVRVVRRVYIDGEWIETRSSWVEDSVTTQVVQPPYNLREEDGTERAGFDLFSQAFVSWRHTELENIILDAGENFTFQIQLRADGEEWGDIVSINRNQLINANNFRGGRFYYMVSGLRHSTVYEMRVRLFDIASDDASLWSNVITFMTGHYDDGRQEEDDWLNHIDRYLRELLRRPHWFAQNTPTRSVMVIRPDEIFAGQMLGHAGTPVPLYNTDVNSIRYYIPASVFRDANENRRGFTTTYSDLQIQFAPSFLSSAHNQAVLDMLRTLDTRGSNLSDYFVRMDLERAPMAPLHGQEGLTRQTDVQLTLVGTNTSIRNLRTWDGNVLTRAERVVDNIMSDPVLRQNIRNLLNDGTSNEDMLDFVASVVTRADNQITQMVGNYMRVQSGGILTNTEMRVQAFDAAVNMVVTNLEPNTSVNAFRLQSGQWVPQPLVEFYNGQAAITHAPGTIAFTGSVVNIHGANAQPQGGAMTSIVARFSLESIFGQNIDLQQNANRHMVVGSVARIAGAPHGADPMTWAVTNLNVDMSSRNADALISRQEAIAVVMALYERRTNTRVDTIMIRNFQNTAGMTLDPRYAQAVRAAFEVGIITDNHFDPSGAITIGEFLDMLASLGNRVGL
ncbi:MAG: hypothetical protein FWE05_07050 [Defluviitaleaceae bacterium]|nr:hypothetical protein [Defluviitaleaceae bacterium]